MDIEKRIEALERKIAELEAEDQERRKMLLEMVGSWQEVLLKFADDYQINSPVLKKLRLSE